MDLGGWLRSLGLEQYEAAFRRLVASPDVIAGESDVLPVVRSVLTCVKVTFVS